MQEEQPILFIPKRLSLISDIRKALILSDEERRKAIISTALNSLIETTIEEIKHYQMMVSQATDCEEKDMVQNSLRNLLSICAGDLRMFR